MDEYIEGLTYATDEPDLKSISEAYFRDTNDNSSTWDVMSDNFDQTRMQWPGKSTNQKKNAVDAKPWRFASDVEVPVIEPRKDRLVAMMMNAIRQGNITALPVGDDDIEESAATADFMRWMFDSWIPDAYEELELSAHNFIEKGIAATDTGWEKRNRPHLERFDLEKFAEEGNLNVAEYLADESNEEDIIAGLQNEFEYVDESEAKKALRQLREQGFADIPVVKQDIDRPVIQAKDPGADIILPPYAMSTKRISRMHYRYFLSATDILSNVETNGWDEDWADDVIKNYMGVSQSDIDGDYSDRNTFASNRRAHDLDSNAKGAPDLAEIAETRIKLIDKDSGAIGIYRIIWCPKQVKTKHRPEHYALYELMNGYDEFPTAITPYMRDTKRIYDVRALPERLRGNQRMAKVTRDSTIDQFSLANNPPRTHPAGRPPSPWGAGADFGARRGEENLYRTLEVPNTRREGVDLERFLDEEADKIAGLTIDDPASIQFQQHLINRWLMHVSEVGRLCYKNFQKMYGKDEIFFRVTNKPDRQSMNLSSMQEELDIKVVFDTRLNDPDYVQKTTETLTQLKAANTDGNYSNKEIDSIVAYLVVPQFASRILRAPQAAQQEILEKVAEDLAIIWSGQQVGARSEGAQTALAYINNVYLQKPSVVTRYNSDEGFQEAIEIYRGQYQQQLVQAQNEVIGRLGTQPAELQGVQQ